MERRTVIKYLFVIAGGTAVLPSCLQQEKSKASILVSNMDISGEQEKMLAEFAETLIPASSTPGAKDTYAHLFVLRMLDDCYDKEEQQKFTRGLKDVEAMVKKEYNTSFVNASPAQRAAILSALEGKKGSEDAQAFYKHMKNLTIQGYLTSKPVMGGIFNYELVPGRYNGAVPVKTTIRQA